MVQPVRAEDSAQVRSPSEISKGHRSRGGSTINGTSVPAGLRMAIRKLMDAMVQQLKIPGPQALSTAERMLDVKLNCPLGGQFTFTTLNGGNQPASTPGNGWWTSSAWATEQLQSDGTVGPPPDYIAPWLRWFRGVELHLTQFPDRLAVVGTLDTHRQPLPPKLGARKKN